MTEPHYAKLTRQQKLAVFLIIIGPDAAAEILRQFEDPEVEALCRHMSAFPIISADVRAAALEEFATIVAESAGSTLGGLPYAQRALGVAKGDTKAATIIGRVGPVASSGADLVKEICEMDGRQIYNLIKHEQPQTISFLLSYLNSAKAAEVFGLLGADVRQEVLERLATIESTSLELVGKVAQRLSRRTDHKPPVPFRTTGGARAVADLLKQLDKDTSKTLLGQLEGKNQQLTAEIRRKLFGFEDLVRVSAADLQRVLRDVDSAHLPVAMKAASEPLREWIFGAMSKRAAEALREEIALLGPVRAREAEAAQDAVIAVVRRLEEEGQVTLEEKGVESVAA